MRGGSGDVPCSGPVRPDGRFVARSVEFIRPARSGPRCSTRSRSLDGAAVRTPTRLSTSLSLPGQRMSPPRGGDLLLRRGLGEPGIGHVAVIADPAASAAETARSRGLVAESHRAGLYRARRRAWSVSASLAARFRAPGRQQRRSPARGTRCCYALRAAGSRMVRIAEDIDVEGAVDADRA